MEWSGRRRNALPVRGGAGFPASASAAAILPGLRRVAEPVAWLPPAAPRACQGRPEGACLALTGQSPAYWRQGAGGAAGIRQRLDYPPAGHRGGRQQAFG